MNDVIYNFEIFTKLHLVRVLEPPFTWGLVLNLLYATLKTVRKLSAFQRAAKSDPIGNRFWYVWPTLAVAQDLRKIFSQGVGTFLYLILRSILESTPGPRYENSLQILTIESDSDTVPICNWFWYVWPTLSVAEILWDF